MVFPTTHKDVVNDKPWMPGNGTVELFTDCMVKII